MWVFDTTLYQIYPLGMLGCPFDAPDLSPTPPGWRGKSSAIASDSYRLGPLPPGARYRRDFCSTPSSPPTPTATTRATCAWSIAAWEPTRISPDTVAAHHARAVCA